MVRSISVDEDRIFIERNVGMLSEFVAFPDKPFRRKSAKIKEGGRSNPKLIHYHTEHKFAYEL